MEQEILGKVVNSLIACIRKDGKILTFGVGGNAANAIHFAAEMAGKYEEYEDPLPCIDLCSNPSILSAIATDFGWENVFSRQIVGLAKPRDVVVAFSISTKGQYLQNAIVQALAICEVILICGKNTLSLSSPNLIVWELNSSDTPKVQERQLEIVHQICKGVKSSIWEVVRNGRTNFEGRKSKRV